MFSSVKKNKQSPEDILNLLRDVGFSLSSEEDRLAIIEELQSNNENGISEVEIALCLMGDEQYDLVEHKPLPWLSDDVWHFDYEAIEGNGSYISIVNACARLARGNLSVSQLNDQIDHESKVANVSFVINRKSFVHNLRYDYDWADPLIFAVLNSELKVNGSDKRFFQHDLFGQDCLLICKTSSEVEKINRATGLHFVELKG